MEPLAHGSLHAASLFGLAGRTALVTGGGRGIGELVARAFVANGANVFIASRSESTCVRTAAALTAAGPGRCIALPSCDVSTDAGCRALIASLAARTQALHILVNNSGISWGAPLEDFPEEQFDRVMALNVKSPFLLTRAARPLLLAGAATGSSSEAASPAGPSRVINIGSIVGLRPQPVPTYSYDASKAALHALTTKLSSELAPSITVNALALGYVPTRMSRGLLHYGKAEQLAAAIPMGRFGSASDVGGAALFLASRAGSWVTGTVLTVDGGTVAQPLTLVAEPQLA
jgi:NAD(P)-dependent dehydrogenase (short-subunit alcohol dehydrogenase family)